MKSTVAKRGDDGGYVGVRAGGSERFLLLGGGGDGSTACICEVRSSADAGVCPCATGDSC
jgi:hypothetical protein